jgi:hypothetical protein
MICPLHQQLDFYFYISLVLVFGQLSSAQSCQDSPLLPPVPLSPIILTTILEMKPIHERNVLSWSYFADYKDPEVAQQLSYYRFRPGHPINKEINKAPSNFELFFGKVPQNYRCGPLKLTDYEEGRLQAFYSIDSAVRAIKEFFGEETPLHFHSFPGLDYLSQMGDKAGGLRVLSGKKYLFPTCFHVFGELAKHLNIAKKDYYICSPCD